MRSNISYLIDERLTLEGELDSFEEYERCGSWDLNKDCDFGGIRGAFNPLQTKFIKDYLRKRIAWYEEEIGKIEREVA